jgi:hypothetical protein
LQLPHPGAWIRIIANILPQSESVAENAGASRICILQHPIGWKDRLPFGCVTRKESSGARCWQRLGSAAPVRRTANHAVLHGIVQKFPAGPREILFSAENCISSFDAPLKNVFCRVLYL